MAEGNKPFVVTDRRKFTMDGEVRPDADRPEREAESAPAAPVAEMRPVEVPPVAEPLAPTKLFQAAGTESGTAPGTGMSDDER